MSQTPKSVLRPGSSASSAWRSLGIWAAVAFARLKDLAPYAMIELVLPGGSVLALTLWLYRRRRKGPAMTASLKAL
jgi:hypothetical protein